MGAALAMVAAACSVGLLAAPVGADTWEVTETGDNAATVGTLRWAIEQANGDAAAPVIDIADGLEIELTCGGGGELAYDNATDQALTINGGGATVTQTCAGDAVLTTATEHITVSSLTLTGGEFGGLSSGGDVAVNGVTGSDNTGGGGIEAYTGDVTVTDSVLTANEGNAGGVAAGRHGSASTGISPLAPRAGSVWRRGSGHLSPSRTTFRCTAFAFTHPLVVSGS